MTADDITLLAEQLAPRVASGLLDDPRFRLMLREVSLAVSAESERIRRENLPREFVACCATAGVHLKVKSGEVFSSGPIPVELEKFQQLFHDEIVAYLTRPPVIHTNGTPEPARQKP